MARKKKTDLTSVPVQVAEISQQPITDTIEKNYMPYVMSVIISRAIPEIDGFKPSHRKLLYTMYKMGLLTGPRTKSANVVGQTMRLNPHGDMAIYETMVRLTRGYEALLHPFVDSKGGFGKQYSRDMAFSASRYTEVKLAPICAELFSGIDKDAVDLVDNYDNTTKEPTLLPTTFPNVLVSPNSGIAVGMASSICSFNLSEVCDGTIALLKNPNTSIDKMLDLIKAPDFSGGGYIIYDREQLKDIYLTGRGSFKLRSRYVYKKESNCIEIIQIPYSTSIEVIMKKIIDMIKEGKLKEISDIRDEIDFDGFKLTIDLRRGVDPDKLMSKLFKTTSLEDDFGCNFNILVDGAPRLMGIIEILKEWIRFRMTCYRRELTYDLNKKKDKLHLLLGLGKILLDIDKAIKIVRETENEADVVPNLAKGFNIDTVQAEYIAEIKLRNLNREYILNRIKEIESLQKDIAEIEEIISDDIKLKSEIAKQLTQIKKKYGAPRKTQLLYSDDITEYTETEDDESMEVHVVFTKEGYFKQITHKSLRGNDEQKLKDGDEIIFEKDVSNKEELLFFSDRCKAYKARVADFEMVKASVLGDYVPARLGFEDGERVISMILPGGYKDTSNVIFVFENGKCAKVPLSSYQTKSNRRMLTGAYSDSSPLITAILEDGKKDIAIISNVSRAIIVSSSIIPLKSTRSTQGVSVFKVKGVQKIVAATDSPEKYCTTPSRYKKTKIPATGTILEEKDIELGQVSITDLE